MKGFSPSEEVPVATIADRVRDMMVIAIPRLLIDEQITLVEPDEFLADDGGAKLFAKQFEYDDTPRMDMTDEVYDLMRLAVPSIGIPVDEMAVSESYSDLPEDGLDGAWEIPCQEEVAETVTIPSMDDGVRLIGAPAEIRMLSPPGPVPVLAMPASIPETVAIEEAAETVETETMEEQYQVEGDAPLVMFSFGPAKVSEGGWTVCFSF